MDKDLRQFLEELEEFGDLVRVKKEIGDGSEIYSILWELNTKGGPAVIFENVKGYDIPIVANIFGTWDRFGMACGFSRGKTKREYRDLFIECMDKKNWKPPKLVKSGPCKEIIIKGEDIDLRKFPIFQWHPKDGGAYITLPAVITKDSKFGVNVSIYRMMLHSKDLTGIMCQIFQDIGIHFGRALKEGKKTMDCAVALGASPAIYIAAGTKIPLKDNEFEFASALQGGEPVQLVKCETVDIDVPANSEIILEGEISLVERKEEGPFGEWMGYFEEAMQLPTFKVKCITHRKNPLYLMTNVGHPFSDGEKIRMMPSIANFTRMARERVTGCVDAWLPETGFNYTAIIAIKKRYPGWGKTAIYQAFSLPFVASSANCVIIVDDDIDPSNLDEVIWSLSTRVDPAFDVILTPPIGGYALNPAANNRFYRDISTKSTDIVMCSKMGIDATLKMEGEERQRPMSIPVKPDEVMLKKVQGKWKEYGF